MKISFVIHSLDGGGAERVMAGLASRLQQRGHACTLITLDDGRKDRHEVDTKVVRVPLDVMKPNANKWQAVLNNLARIRRLRQAIRNSQPDVILSFCDVTNVLTLLSTRGLSAPVVISERSDPALQLIPWPWSRLRPKLYRSATTIIALTTTSAQTLARWSRTVPIVIPSAVDKPPCSDGCSSPTNQAKWILGVGRLEYEKGFDRLVSAFAMLASRFPEWNLRIVGEGSQRQNLERMIQDADLTGRVELPGWQRPIWPSYAHSDLFVLPSRYEGFPSALLEAMASGMAVISVDCESGPRAIVRNGIDGQLVPNDENALVQAMKHCMSDDSLRQTLGQAASNITDRFGWNAMVTAYEQVLTNAATLHHH
jgi:GalNAc-alpha-(1->4)-GalNAc-alpha-(1->3)-diNAcBac-PP-undecaprenol alpha-1,4-N-acetyl-D-galactosaminyltransferase